jgi:hypothetical protein
MPLETDADPRIKEMRTCPVCGGIDTYAFNKIGDPVAADDGTYAVCPDCKVYWRLTSNWPMWGEIDEKSVANPIGCSRLQRAS